TPDRPARMSYTVDSARPAVPDAALAAATRSTDPALAPYVAKPADVPDEFKRFAVDAVPDTGSDSSQLEHLAATLRSAPYATSPKALPGHSLGRLTQLVFTNPNAPNPAANQIGTSEQYAAAFALAARLVDYPSRVVVGFTIDATQAAGGQPI